jgi:hypothetical protein
MRPALRTRSRREPLADDFHASAGLLALIEQLRSELTPASIQYRFCHARTGQLHRAHIANDYPLVALHYGVRKLVQGIGPTAGDLTMDAPRGLSVRSTLGLREPVCVTLSPPMGLQASAVARYRHVLQAQVDADGLTRGDTLLHLHLNRQTQPPVSNGILRKAAVAPLRLFQAHTFEDPQMLTTETHACTAALEAHRLEGHPAQRAASAA